MKSHTPKGQTSRDHLVVAAEHLFATRGFHGTSTRAIARSARVPLASLVYHFARKEQLYGAVLDTINAELLAALDHADLVDALVDWAITQPDRARLLLRELLDNPVRVQTAAKLPLAPFLLRAIAELDVPSRASGELAVLHLVGGISYVVAAWPTVTRIIGAPRAKQLAVGYRAEAVAFANRVLERKPSHERSPATHPDPPRARAPRSPNDRPRSRAVLGAGRRLPR